MAITRVTGASSQAINAGAVTVDFDESVMLVDDLILFAWSCGDDDFTQPTLAMTTAGYTELTTTTLSADGGTAGDGNLAVFYKWHNGTDTNAVSAASGTGTDSSNACAVQVFRGVAKDGLPGGSGPLEIAIATASGTTTGDPNPPSVNTFDESTAVVVICNASSGSAAPTHVAPANYGTNAVIQDANAETFRAGVSIMYREDPADPEDPGTVVANGAGAWCAATLVLKALTVVDNRAEVSFAELEVPSPNNRAEVSWAELEVPTIPAPEAWFMADAGTGSAVNNDPVPTWSDQSGNANDASQATGTYQPIYKTNVQNGLPVLDFTDHSYTIPGILDALNGAGGASVFAVWKSRDFVSPVAAEVFYMSTATGTSSRFTLEQRSQADGNQHNLVVRRLDGDAATHLNGPPNQTGMPFIISSAVVDLPGNTAKLYRGGAEVASAAPSVGSTFTATNSARAAIGSFDPAGAPPTRTLDGQIGELIFYPRALTTAERQRVETYLVDKWATAVNNRAEVSWAEFEVPSPNNRAEVSWAEMEIPSPDNRAEVSWTELEVPDVGIINNRAEVSWAELEVPTPDNRAEVSWAEVEVPDVAIPDNRAEVSWAEMEVPSPNNRAEVSWAEFEVPDVGAAVPGTPQEWAVWYLDTYDHCNVLQHRHYPVNHELEPNMPPGWVRP